MAKLCKSIVGGYATVNTYQLPSDLLNMKLCKIFACILRLFMKVMCKLTCKMSAVIVDKKSTDTMAEDGKRVCEHICTVRNNSGK